MGNTCNFNLYASLFSANYIRQSLIPEFNYNKRVVIGRASTRLDLPEWTYVLKYLLLHKIWWWNHVAESHLKVSFSRFPREKGWFVWISGCCRINLLLFSHCSFCLWMLNLRAPGRQTEGKCSSPNYQGLRINRTVDSLRAFAC